METRILLIRHGQSLANKEKIFAGQSNVPLTSLGIKQAEIAAEALKDMHIDLIFSSSLDRAYDTALPFAKMRGLDIVRLESFAEWDVGSWESMKFEDVKKNYPDEYHLWKTDLANMKMPNGESANQVRDRMGKALDAIAKDAEGKSVLIVSHGGIIRSVPSYFAHCDDKIFTATPVPENCSITEIIYENGTGRVKRYSDDSHLEEFKSEAFII